MRPCTHVGRPIAGDSTSLSLCRNNQHMSNYAKHFKLVGTNSSYRLWNIVFDFFGHTLPSPNIPATTDTPHLTADLLARGNGGAGRGEPGASGFDCTGLHRGKQVPPKARKGVDAWHSQSQQGRKDWDRPSSVAPTNKVPMGSGPPVP